MSSVPTPAIKALQIERRKMYRQKEHVEQRLRLERQAVDRYEQELTEINSKISDLSRAIAALSYPDE